MISERDFPLLPALHTIKYIRITKASLEESYL